MTVEFVILLLTGAAAGGFINGLAGFGTALFTLGFWLQILPTVEAVALILVMSVATGLQGLWLVRQEILNKPGRVARFLIPAVFGVPLGVHILSFIDADILKLIVAGFMISYGGFFAFRSALPTLTATPKILDGLIGFLGGVLGGIAGLSGALPTFWCSLRPWPKQETRAVLQPFNVVILFLAVLFLAARGVYTTQVLTWFLMALPVGLASAYFGLQIFKRLETDSFRRLLIILLLVSGCVLLARTVL